MANKLQNLIQELCPDGVKFVKLGEVCSLSRGKVFSKKYLEQHPGNYPVYSSQTANNGEFGRIDTYDYDGDYLTWTTDGAYAGTVFYRKGKFSITNVCGLIKVESSNLNLRFLYYWLTLVAKDYVYAGMGNPKLMSNQVAPIEIPLPPLAIQSRIVEILDNFSSLTAELQAELQARRSQYEHYRNHLLSFDGYDNIQNENNTTTNNSAAAQGKTVKWVKLGDVCDTVTDYTAAGSFADLAKNVIYNREPDFALLVRTTDIKSNFTKGDFVYINEHAFNYLWRVNLDKVSLVMPNVGNCGEVYYLTSEELPYEKCCLAPNALLLRSSSQNMKYLYHLLKTYDFQNRLKKIISPVGQTKFNKTELKQILIPLPSLSEQRRIADILDRFEALTTDLQCGLPAEIEARQQQYEYYRNKLLTFEPKK